jgi:hypothetical protein
MLLVSVAALMSARNPSAGGVHHAIRTPHSPFITHWYKHLRECLRSALEPKPLSIFFVVCGCCSISRIFEGVVMDWLLIVFYAAMMLVAVTMATAVWDLVRNK